MLLKLFSKLVRILIITCVLLFFIALPQLILILSTKPQIYAATGDIPAKEFGVLFGARVYEDEGLSDVVKERADATVLLYRQKKIKKIFVSGDNRHNQEADNIAEYLVSQGIHSNIIWIDQYGIDTHDTCKHLEKNGITDVMLITQNFHLPRAMQMCSNNVESLVGIQVNELGLLTERGSNNFVIYKTRIARFFREAILTWSYLIGVYDWYSNEAEELIKTT